MKKQVFYIHGGESFLDYDKFLERLGTREIRDLPNRESYIKWTHKLETDLGDDYEVFKPQMPNSWNAKYDEWKIWFERYFEHLHDGAILIGCSLGAMFLTKYLVENDTPFKIKCLYIMASPVSVEDFDETDCGSFVFDLNDVSRLVDKAEKIFILHSEDDFLVPYEHALKFKNMLPAAELVTFTDKNHFLIPELPELIDLIKKT